MPDHDVVVIGSGPAGAAAAHALCDAGRAVTVIDAGDRIEPGRMQPFQEMARSEPERWPPGLADRVRDAFPADVKHVPLKPAFGSLFPYVIDDPDLPISSVGTDTLSSLAYGGLSNAWGASILPFDRDDIEGWPISLAELQPHYEAVLRFVPVSAERDELSETLPLYTDAPESLRRGEQAEQLLGHLRRHRPQLERAGLSFGASRLAVRASTGDDRRCRHSGMCLYGCPYGSIYNAAHAFEQLRAAGRIRYRGGLYVDRLSGADGAVRIDLHERGIPGSRAWVTASRVLVACGAISSTRLVLDSTGHRDRPVQMLDSQYCVIPMLTRHAAPVSVATQGNTLAQLFLELEGGHVCRHAIHLQLYGYNDIMLAALTKRLPLRRERLERALRPLLGRLVVIQGFVHSTDSPGLTVACGAEGLTIAGEDVTAGSALVRRLVRHLLASGRALGMVPLPGLVHVGHPGKSNHLGASFPMNANPGELETDLLGRIPAWERVHLIDASVFPSLPARTVTLSIMANAHRIATAVARLVG
jgi:choline dehydrogenase-like flavoprotein